MLQERGSDISEQDLVIIFPQCNTILEYTIRELYRDL